MQSPDGSSQGAAYSVISESDGAWIIIGLDQVPPGGDTLKVLASITAGGNIQNRSGSNVSSIGIDTFINATSEKNVSIPSGFEDIDDFMNQSNASQSNSTTGIQYANPTYHGNQANNSYVDIDTFLNTTSVQQSSFAAIMVGSHIRGSSGLIPVSFNGSLRR